ncbi:MAG TPA: SpoIIE family protein phosphatase [Gemmata sp.]|nr:SpoIIE family protein phosphatase [Gemmata sp.]
MIQTFSFSEAGGHPINEDAFVLHPFLNEAEGWLVCLADGQGGRAGGGPAAQLACRTVADHVAATSGAGLDKPDSWVEILTRADQAVAADPTAGFTTLVDLSVQNDCVTGASCGDSAVLVVCGSGSIVELTSQQFKNPPVGFGDATFVPFTAKLVRPWRLLAMSDGMWKYVGWQRVRELAMRLTGARLLAELQTAARLRGSGEFQDDFTVVLIEAMA